MRICLLSNAASVHVQRWASYFVKRDHEVHVVSFDPGSIPGATVHHVWWWPRVKQIGYLLALPRIRRVLDRIHPDVLHAHYAISYGVLGALSGFKPLAIGVWGSDVLISPGKSRVRWTILEHALRRADLITSLAEHLTRVLIARGISEEKIETLPFGVDTQLFHRDPKLRNCKEIDIICTRNFSRVYNIELLLRALAILVAEKPDLKCVLAGDGPRRESLKALARQLAINRNITWLGWISSNDLAMWLQRSKVYVSPSLSDGTSTALTEAMACGCFPIVLDIPANRPWITDGKTGFLVAEASPEHLADSILKALNRNVDLQRAAEANSEIVFERADWHSVMRRIEAHHFRLAGSVDREFLRSESPCPRN